MLNSVRFFILAADTVDSKSSDLATIFDNMGWHNVVEGDGIAIAITGMLIVFVALVLIAGAIAALPKILAVLDPILPVADHHHHAPTPSERVPADEEKVVAAIGMVLHTEMQKASSP